MSARDRLTPAQLQFLRELAQKDSVACSPEYGPAVSLVRKGFASLSETKYGGGIATITLAGYNKLLSLPAPPSSPHPGENAP